MEIIKHEYGLYLNKQDLLWKKIGKYPKYNNIYIDCNDITCKSYKLFNYITQEIFCTYDDPCNLCIVYDINGNYKRRFYSRVRMQCIDIYSNLFYGIDHHNCIYANRCSDGSVVDFIELDMECECDHIVYNIYSKLLYVYCEKENVCVLTPFGSQ